MSFNPNAMMKKQFEKMIAKDVLGNQFTYVSPVGVEKMIA